MGAVVEIRTVNGGMGNVSIWEYGRNQSLREAGTEVSSLLLTRYWIEI